MRLSNVDENILSSMPKVYECTLLKNLCKRIYFKKIINR